MRFVEPLCRSGVLAIRRRLEHLDKASLRRIDIVLPIESSGRFDGDALVTDMEALIFESARYIGGVRLQKEKEDALFLCTLQALIKLSQQEYGAPYECYAGGDCLREGRRKQKERVEATKGRNNGR